MEETSLFIFILVFILLTIVLTIIAIKQDKKTVGELHIYSNGEGEPPTWNFTLKKDLDINSVTELKYATFKVLKEE